MSEWRVYAKKADFKAIQDKYHIDQVLARIIRNRDVETDHEIDLYLNGDSSGMHDPTLLKDGVKAAKMILEKIEKKAKIRIIGDYDIDGVCSICILYRALAYLGADVDYTVPHRILDGYGINEHLIDQAIADGIDTVITCDNGIAAINQIQYAKDNGLTVIVTDHHDVPFTEEDGKKVYHKPNADAVVNPKQEDCHYPFELICGASVAHKLVEILFDLTNADTEALRECEELMAIATVGDVVDLKDENRIIVKRGLKHIAKTRNVGLKALINACGLDMNHISSYHIGFVIGPCLNASGRLDTALRAIELLLCKDPAKAHIMAEHLKELNDERKEITEKESKKAIEMVESSELSMDNVLVVYLPECHESVAGIIAGRIRERFYKPTFVITNAEDGAKGSGRSIDGYNMFEEISKCSEVLTKFGGHPMAAGLSLPIENIETFRKMLNQNETLTEHELTPVTWIDVPMPVDYASMNLVEQLSILEPFGKGNEKPVFADRNLRVRSARLIGKNSNVLKMELESANGQVVQAIKFKVDHEIIPNKDDIISIVYYPDINEFNGRKTLQFVVKEIKRK